MTDEIMKVEQAGFLAPVVTAHDALVAYQAKKDLIDGIMRKDVDFGVIPGSSKPTLLKAGAEKATSFFGLSPRFTDAGCVEDWTGEAHGGEPFFYYRRTCNLYRGSVLVASVDGSCNSWEKKYRYRSAERVCPQCGKSTIIKGKQEYGGGFICFSKKGGCGAKFTDNDPAITGQEIGQVKNPDVADIVNTILKMADKRALVAATLIATGLSEYFTQDIEDYVTGEFTEVSAHRAEHAEEPAEVHTVQVEMSTTSSPETTDKTKQEFRHAALWKRVQKAGLLNTQTVEVWKITPNDTVEDIAGRCELMHVALGDR
jgi:hypothetical protein